MKKKFTCFMTLLLAMGMILNLTACGGKDEGKESEPSTPFTEQTETQSKEPLPARAVMGDYTVTVLSVEEFDTDEAGKGIRFYFEFANNSKESTNVGSIFRTAIQDGMELEETYAASDSTVSEELNYRRYLRPGAVIRCVDQYAYNPEGGAISYELERTHSDEVFRVEVKPDQFTGRPSEDLEIQLIADPTWTKGLSMSGVHQDKYSIQIDHAEKINSGTAVRVYFTFANNSEEAVFPWSETQLKVYQDGVELLTTFPDEKIDEDIAYGTELEPGATAIVSECYELFSDSPIELEFLEVGGDSVIGTVFHLN